LPEARVTIVSCPHLEAAIGVAMPATLVFDYPSVLAIAQYLLAVVVPPVPS